MENQIRQESHENVERVPAPVRRPNVGAMSMDELRAEVARLGDELIRAEWQIAELEARADVDPFLDIFNRRGFERELRRSLAFIQRYGAQAALVFIDLDGFKDVNDRHGHAAGDGLLKQVAQTLTANVRASDVVARYGGDEFAVLLWHIPEEQARLKARDLERVIDATAIEQGGARLSVGASAGMVPLTGGLEAGAAMEAADRAMYARKRERRG